MDKKKIVRAGLIPYIVVDGVVEMMFMVPSDPNYGGPDWQCCKGKVEDGETEQETAIREAREELGLFPANIDGAVHELGVFLGRTHMYVCKISDRDLFGEPHFETGDTTWMTYNEFKRIGRSLHVPVVDEAIKLIRKIEGL